MICVNLDIYTVKFTMICVNLDIYTVGLNFISFV